MQTAPVFRVPFVRKVFFFLFCHRFLLLVLFFFLAKEEKNVKEPDLILRS